LTIRGKVESNASGDKIVIDTSNGVGRLRGLNSANQILFHLGFEDGNPTLSLLSAHSFDGASTVINNGRMQITNTTTNAYSLIGP
jgi:hypothetical protein